MVLWKFSHYYLRLVRYAALVKSSTKIWIVHINCRHCVVYLQLICCNLEIYSLSNYLFRLLTTSSLFFRRERLPDFHWISKKINHFCISFFIIWQIQLPSNSTYFDQKINIDRLSCKDNANAPNIMLTNQIEWQIQAFCSKLIIAPKVLQLLNLLLPPTSAFVRNNKKDEIWANHFSS